jgi:pilus assembly protein CpaB
MRRGRLLLLIGLLLVVIVVVAGGYLWWSGRLGVSTPEVVETVVATPALRTVDVVVAAQDIPRGTRITQESNAVVVQTWLADSAPEAGLSDPTQAYGRIARVDIVRGSPMLPGMLTDRAGQISAAGSDAALQIPEGRVAYALPVARYSSVAWAIQPGDHVDVLVSLRLVDLDEEFQAILPNQFTCATESEACQGGVLGRLEALPNGWIVNMIPSEGQRSKLVTQLTVQDGLVLRLGDWREPVSQPAPAEGEEVTPTPVPKVQPLTLAVTPQQALVLKYAQEAGASMDLVLRSLEDADRELETESVTLEYLLEQYAIEQPAKLPYGTQGAGSRD